jgi:hypothetical protein
MLMDIYIQRYKLFLNFSEEALLALLCSSTVTNL